MIQHIIWNEDLTAGKYIGLLKIRVTWHGDVNSEEFFAYGTAEVNEYYELVSLELMNATLLDHFKHRAGMDIVAVGSIV